MTNLEIARKVVVLATDLGAEMAVSSTVRSLVPMHSAFPIRVCQHMGRFAFMGLGGRLAGKYAGEMFDDIVAAFKGDDTIIIKHF